FQGIGVFPHPKRDGPREVRIEEVRLELERAPCAGQGRLDDFRASPPFQRAYRIALAQGGMAQRELRVELDSEPKHLLGSSMRIAGSIVEQVTRLEVERVCLRALARDALEHIPIALLQLHLQ